MSWGRSSNRIHASCTLPAGSVIETWVNDDENVVTCPVSEMTLIIEFETSQKAKALKQLRALVRNLSKPEGKN